MINELVFDIFPVLETERLVLRAFQEHDAEDMFRIYSDKKAMRFWGSPPMTEIGSAIWAIVVTTFSWLLSAVRVDEPADWHAASRLTPASIMSAHLFHFLFFFFLISINVSPPHPFVFWTNVLH